MNEGGEHQHLGEVKVPKTGNFKEKTGEALHPSPRVTLTKYQVERAFDLLSHHPLLSNEEEQLLNEWSNEFIRANGPTKADFVMRNSAIGLRDLMIYNPHESEYAAEVTPLLKKMEKGTNFEILDLNSFRNPENIPIELQFALGIDGEKRIQDVMNLLEKGSKLAFMKVETVPPEVHNALHLLIDTLGGATNPVIDIVRTDTPLDLNRFPPEQREEIKQAQETLRRGSHQLVQLRILNNAVDEVEARETEREINNALDKHVDVPYTVWRYTLHAVNGDVKIATIALAVSAGVALALNQVGLGASKDVVMEGLKLTLPVLTADLATNIAGAVPFVKENLPPKDKLLEIIKVVFTKFKLPLAVGAGMTPVLAMTSAYLESIGWTDIDGLVLGASSLLPTYITKKVAENMYTEHSNDPEKSHNEVSSHPVQKSLMRGSIASFIATAALGPAGLMTNPWAVTATTEMAEPLVTGGAAGGELVNNQRKYNKLLSGYPNQLFQKTVNDYFLRNKK